MPKTKRSKNAGPEYTLADKYGFCYCHFGIINEGQRIYQRDNRDVCEQCAPLYDLRRVAHEGGTTSKAVKRRKTA